MSAQKYPDWLEDRKPSRCCSLPAINQSQRTPNKPRLSLISNATFNYPLVLRQESVTSDNNSLPIIRTSPEHGRSTDRQTMTSAIGRTDNSMQTDLVAKESKTTMTSDVSKNSRATMTSAKTVESKATMTVVADNHNQPTMTLSKKENIHQPESSPFRLQVQNSMINSIGVRAREARRKVRLYWRFVPAASDYGENWADMFNQYPGYNRKLATSKNTPHLIQLHMANVQELQQRGFN